MRGEAEKSNPVETDTFGADPYESDAFDQVVEPIGSGVSAYDENAALEEWGPIYSSKPPPFEIAVRSDPGKQHTVNEDSYGIVEPRQDFSLYFISDGLGGPRKGSMASTLAVTSLTEYFEGLVRNGKEQSLDISEIAKALTQANSKVFSTGKRGEEYAGLGCTVTGFIYRGGKIFSFHIGNSRLYRVNDEGISQLTQDHTVLEELKSQGVFSSLSADPLSVAPILTRSLGLAASVDPEIKELPPLQPKEVLLLCSDGLYSVVSPAEMSEAIRSATSLDEAADALLFLAEERGAEDDITLLLIRATEGLHSSKESHESDSSSQRGLSDEDDLVGWLDDPFAFDWMEDQANGSNLLKSKSETESLEQQAHENDGEDFNDFPFSEDTLKALEELLKGAGANEESNESNEESFFKEAEALGSEPDTSKDEAIEQGSKAQQTEKSFKNLSQAETVSESTMKEEAETVKSASSSDSSIDEEYKETQKKKTEKVHWTQEGISEEVLRELEESEQFEGLFRTERVSTKTLILQGILARAKFVGILSSLLFLGVVGGHLLVSFIRHSFGTTPEEVVAVRDDVSEDASETPKDEAEQALVEAVVARTEQSREEEPPKEQQEKVVREQDQPDPRMVDNQLLSSTQFPERTLTPEEVDQIVKLSEDAVQSENVQKQLVSEKGITLRVSSGSNFSQEVKRSRAYLKNPLLSQMIVEVHDAVNESLKRASAELEQLASQQARINENLQELNQELKSQGSHDDHFNQ